ncbi:uncharacterized protein LOC102800588 [Saccoglossus kowalevskii]|uniref:GDP-fucose protein O-fucosyltransferase 2 n=1 Tax=Saccoglossus kowalevskii TaxID=10224 RepID=A0ABM0M572_SACKO|nr:PREDICTED: uncharacterized protein LOC102800588 [Saccoglossus kowalevskii]
MANVPKLSVILMTIGVGILLLYVSTNRSVLRSFLKQNGFGKRKFNPSPLQKHPIKGQISTISHIVSQNGQEELQSGIKKSKSSNVGLPIDSHEVQLLNSKLQNDVKESSTKLHSNKPNPNEARYLLPLVIYGHQGPNSIYHSYRFAINYALQQNRSIVQIPFRSHDGNNFEKFHETFDTDKLSELLPVKSIGDFRKDCGRDIPFESLVNLRVSKLEETVLKRASLTEGTSVYSSNNPELYENLLGIQLPIIKDYGPSWFESAMRYFSSMDIPCIAVFLVDSRRVHDKVNDSIDNYGRIDRYLIRASYIQETADKVAKQICNGEDFVALHWRNMGTAGCRHGECEKMELLYKNIPTLVECIDKFVRSNNIQCIYVSTKRGENPLISGLNSTSLTVYSQQSILQIPTLANDLNIFVNDPYKFSLLEQEICIRSKLFIKNRWSTWSDFVLFARDSQKKETVDFTDIKGIPRTLLVIKSLVRKRRRK